MLLLKNLSSLVFILSNLLFFYHHSEILMMDPIWDLKRWYKNVHTVDSPVPDSKDTNHRSLKSNTPTSLGLLGPWIR